MEVEEHLPSSSRGFEGIGSINVKIASSTSSESVPQPLHPSFSLT
jgi:hypothetical protein